MSRPGSSREPDRRRKRGLGPRGLQGWGAEEEEEAWACPPSPRRGRWERPGPSDWEPEEPPSETEARPGPPLPRPSWDRKEPPLAGWRGRPKNRRSGEPWGRADSQKPWDGPPGDGGGSLEQPRRQRVSRPGGGGRWSSPERTAGGRRRSPSPGQGPCWDSPEALSRQQGPNGDTRAWGSPGREGAWERSRSIERPAWEQRQGSPAGAAGRWVSSGRKKEEIQSPSRVQRDFGNSRRGVRPEGRGGIGRWSQPSKEQVVDSFDRTRGRRGRTQWRGREHPGPARKQSIWGTPQGEARQERSGSTRHHAREESQERSGSTRHQAREESQERSGSTRHHAWEESQERSGSTKHQAREESQERSGSTRHLAWEESQERSGSTRHQAREESQERSGSTRHHAREESQENPDEAGSRWSSAWCRDRSRQNHSRSLDSLRREQQSPNGEARGQSSPISYRGAENLDGAGGGSQEGRGEKKRMYAARSSSPKVASASLTDLTSSSFAVPKEWKPRESVVHWWMECQSPLPKRQRDQLISICPRPTLPDSLSEAPQINPDILSLLIKKEERLLQSSIRFTLLLQDEVLDMLAPAMTIYEMAEEAMEKGEPVDPMELREWSRHLLRFLGSMNNRLTFKHRSQVLGSINPRLKLVVSKMSSQSTEGMLFAADKVKLLKEIIMRFPQLTEAKRRMPGVHFHSFTQVASHRRPRRRIRASRQGTADLRGKQSYGQGARGQGPAEGPSDAVLRPLQAAIFENSSAPRSIYSISSHEQF